MYTLSLPGTIHNNLQSQKNPLRVSANNCQQTLYSMRTPRYNCYLSYQPNHWQPGRPPINHEECLSMNLDTLLESTSIYPEYVFPLFYSISAFARSTPCSSSHSFPSIPIISSDPSSIWFLSNPYLTCSRCETWLFSISTSCSLF